MKMGIKEFRERISEVAHGTEIVEVTHHGKTLALLHPLRRDPAKIRAAASAIQDAQDGFRDKGVDLEAELAAIGLDPWGEPLNADDHR